MWSYTSQRRGFCGPATAPGRPSASLEGAPGGERGDSRRLVWHARPSRARSGQRLAVRRSPSLRVGVRVERRQRAPPGAQPIRVREVAEPLAAPGRQAAAQELATLELVAWWPR